MRRLALVLFVAALAVSTSGLIDLAVPEPCSLGEASTGQDDRDCAATCVRCTGCPQSIELLAIRPIVAALCVFADARPAFAFIPADNPSDILHVPRPRTV